MIKHISHSIIKHAKVKDRTSLFSASMIGLLSFVLLCFSVISGLALGAVDISFVQVINAFSSATQPNESQHFISRIVLELRLPRIILAFIAGTGLAIAGFVLQTVTRNPLADPYLFGISSGASFGVVLLISFIGAASSVSMSSAAFVGSLSAMFLLISIAGSKQTQQVESMLLAGVALSFLFSSFTSLLLYYSDPQAISAILFWTLGSFSRAQWDILWFPSVVVFSAILILLVYRRQLNAMLLGDESATTLGIRVKHFRLLMLIISSLITATIVSMCGGIGFVGLMIPHIVRFFISQGSIFSMLITALAGGVFMIWVDILSRTILPNQELPVGVITAGSGSLFFLGLLYFRKSSKA